MEQGGTSRRAVLGKEQGLFKAETPAKPRLFPSNAESQIVKATASTVNSRENGSFKCIQFGWKISNYPLRKLLSLFHMVLLPVDDLADPQPHVAYSNLLGSSTPLYNMVLHIYLDNDNTLGCTSPLTLIHGSNRSAHSVFG